MTHIREKMKSYVEPGHGSRSASANVRQGRDESGASVMSAPSSRSGANYSDSDSRARLPSTAPVTPPAPMQGLSPSQRSTLFDRTNSSKGSISPRGLQAQLAQNSSAEAQAIAAKAVAMVVNSSRKGIVPLCADVANLLRINQALEKRVSLLVVENAALRSACRSVASPAISPGASCSPAASGSPGASCSPAASGSTSEVEDGPLFSTTSANPPSESLPHPSSLADSNGSSSSFSSPRYETNYAASPASDASTTAAVSAAPVISSAAVVQSSLAASVAADAYLHLPPSPPLSTSSTSSSPMQTFPRINALATASSSSSSSSSASPAVRSSRRFDDADLRPIRDEANRASVDATCVKVEATRASGDATRVDATRASVDANRVSVDVIVHPQPSNTKSTKKSTKSADAVAKLNHVECDKKSEFCDMERREDERNATKDLHRLDGRPADVLYELAAAKEEIEALRHRLQELEMAHLAQSNPGIPCKAAESDDTEEVRPESIDGTADSADQSIRQLAAETKEDKIESDVPVSLSADRCGNCPKGGHPALASTSPLRGCKCESCLDFGEGDGADSRAVPPSPGGLFLEIGDHVVARGDLTGHVAYMGHLDADHVVGRGDMTGCVAYVGPLDLDRNNDQSGMILSVDDERDDREVFEKDERDLSADESHRGPSASLHVGLILDAPVGTHDGQIKGKRYFKCEMNYGVFVHLEDIKAVISPKKSDFAATRRNEIQSTTLSTLSTKTTGEPSPPQHSHSKLNATNGNHQRLVASHSKEAATLKALSSVSSLSPVSAISAVKSKLSPGVDCSPQNEFATSHTPLRRCKKLKEIALSQPDEIVRKDVGKSVVKTIDHNLKHGSSSSSSSSVSSSAASSLSLSPKQFREKCNDDSATSMKKSPRNNLPELDPPIENEKSSRVENAADVEQRQGVASDADQTYKYTKRSSSAAASIRSSLSSLVGFTSSCKLKSSPSQPPPPTGAASCLRTSVFKNPLPSLPTHPALSPKSPSLGDESVSEAVSSISADVVRKASTDVDGGIAIANGKASSDVDEGIAIANTPVNHSVDVAKKFSNGGVASGRKAASIRDATTSPFIERVASSIVWNKEIERNLDETRC